MSQDITYNVTGQSLFLDSEGRPDSAPTVAVYPLETGDNGTAEAAISGTSLENPASVALSSAAGPSQTNPRAIVVADTSDLVVKREYELVGDGRVERIVIESIVDATNATLAFPLANDFAASDIVRSARMLAAIDSTWVADSGNLKEGSSPRRTYRVRWEYAVGGVTKVRDTYFDLVRYEADHSVTAIDIDNEMPGFLNGMPRQHRADQGQRLIDSAFDRVKFRLRGAKIAESAVRENDIIDRLVLLQTKINWLEARFYDGEIALQPALDDARERFTVQFQQAVSVVGATPVGDADGAASVPRAVGITQR